MKTTIAIAFMGIVFVIVASALIPDAFCDSAINNPELTCNSQK